MKPWVQISPCHRLPCGAALLFYSFASFHYCTSLHSGGESPHEVALHKALNNVVPNSNESQRVSSIHLMLGAPQWGGCNEGPAWISGGQIRARATAVVCCALQ